MTDRIYIRAWKKHENTPVLDREIVYVREEKALYIGTPEGTVKLCDVEAVPAINNRIDGLETRITALEKAINAQSDE